MPHIDVSRPAGRPAGQPASQPASQPATQRPGPTAAIRGRSKTFFSKATVKLLPHWLLRFCCTALHQIILFVNNYGPVAVKKKLQWRRGWGGLGPNRGLLARRAYFGPGLGPGLAWVRAWFGGLCPGVAWARPCLGPVLAWAQAKRNPNRSEEDRTPSHHQNDLGLSKSN